MTFDFLVFNPCLLCSPTIRRGNTKSQEFKYIFFYVTIHFKQREDKDKNIKTTGQNKLIDTLLIDEVRTLQELQSVQISIEIKKNSTKRCERQRKAPWQCCWLHVNLITPPHDCSTYKKKYEGVSVCMIQSSLFVFSFVQTRLMWPSGWSNYPLCVKLIQLGLNGSHPNSSTGGRLYRDGSVHYETQPRDVVCENVWADKRRCLSMNSRTDPHRPDHHLSLLWCEDYDLFLFWERSRERLSFLLCSGDLLCHA